MSDSTSSIGTGISLLVFIVLFVGKIFAIGQVATWSWWWVTTPLWGPIILRMAVGLAVGVIRDTFRMTAKLFK